MELKPAIVVSDDIVEEMRALTTELDQLEPTLARLGERLYRVLFAQMKEVNPQLSSDDDIGLVYEGSGRAALESAAMRAVAHLTCALDSKCDDPEWVKPLQAERKAWFVAQREAS